MTINIEQERREFEAACGDLVRLERAPGAEHQYNWASGEMAWKVWLAAKRASVGSVEPVARLLHWVGPKHITAPFDGLAARTYAEFSEKEANKPNSYWRNGALLYTAPPSTDAKDAFIDNLPKPIYRNKHAGGTVGYLATEHYNEGWNDCLEAIKAIAAKEPT